MARTRIIIFVILILYSLEQSKDSAYSSKCEAAPNPGSDKYVCLDREEDDYGELGIHCCHRANEYTDGKIVFECLEGFTCDKQEIEEPRLTIFQLENEGLASITVCSDYDTDATFSNFKSYWDSWEDETAKKYKGTEIENGTNYINSHQYFIKTIKYNVDGNETYWRFVLMFDTTTGKVAVVSCYDGGYDEYLEPFLSTIRFQ